MDSLVIRCLQRSGLLTEDDLKAVEAVLSSRIKRIEAGRILIQKGERPALALLILDGWAYRYKTLSNGRRQIVAYMIPGDVSDLHMFVTPRMDHAIASLTALTFVELSQDQIIRFFDGTRPRVAAMFSTKALTAASIQREWTVNLGQRSAPERIGHILCELFHRLKAVGMTDDRQCYLPLTQNDLAEATGLSLVHVNKRLQDLRNAGLIILRGKTLTIPDLRALENASLFIADYLNICEDSDIAPLSGAEKGSQTL